ncbi:MAG: glycosyltransferase family 2 protein [Candidatus Binatia bacterium]
MTYLPQVTVFIPVHNRERYVGDAIESVLGQNFDDFELLVIDDGSTDHTREIIRSYASDPRVRVIENPDNLGIPRTRNRGIELARGRYLALLDSDDVAHPSRLGMQVEFLDQHPDYALIGAWTGGMDNTGQYHRRVRLLPVSAEEVRCRLLFQCCPAQSSIMARTAILRAYKYREDYAVSSDYDLWIRLAGSHKLGSLPRVLVRSRMHQTQVTQERAQLIMENCLSIMRSQLRALGVPFSETDLRQHFFLLRMRKRQFVPDWRYVTWADAWLQKLREANVHNPTYEQKPLARLLGQIWFLICWRASSHGGWTAWRQFWRSPLCHEFGASVRRYWRVKCWQRGTPLPDEAT